MRAAGVRARHLPQQRRRRFNIRLRCSHRLADDRTDAVNLCVNELIELAALAAATEHGVGAERNPAAGPALTDAGSRKLWSTNRTDWPSRGWRRGSGGTWTRRAFAKQLSGMLSSAMVTREPPPWYHPEKRNSKAVAYLALADAVVPLVLHPNGELFGPGLLTDEQRESRAKATSKHRAAKLGRHQAMKRTKGRPPVAPEVEVDETCGPPESGLPALPEPGRGLAGAGRAEGFATLAIPLRDWQFARPMTAAYPSAGGVLPHVAYGPGISRPRRAS